VKNIISYFIKYPVAVNVFIIAFFVFGLIGISNLKSSFFPLTDSSLIGISFIYPGASPQEVEEGVVSKIEDNLKGIVGVDRVTSVSSENFASISIEIDTKYNINKVLSNIKNAVDRVPSLPSGLEPPVVEIIESVRSTISFTLSGKNIPLKTLKQYARNIESELLAIDGISQVDLSGFPEEEIEIALSEANLRAYDLTFQEVATAVAQSNILISGGNIKTPNEDYLIRAKNKNYRDIDFLEIVVKSTPSGELVRLRDVATVKTKWAESPNRIYYNGETSIYFSVSNTNNEDLLKSAASVKGFINKFNQQNEQIQINIASDSSITLSQRTKLLAENGFVGILLVLLFLSLFLSPRIAFWVAAGLPISFLGMFVFAPMIGVTINVLSLFGMIIVIGILVDDGIVIGENIYHHYERGKTPIRAAIDGTLEVVPPIISAIATTIIAFSTFFFIDGRIGEFFTEVSAVVILTLLISLIEALLILPAHIAHSKALKRKKKVEDKKTGIFAFIRGINKHSENFLFYIRDRLYAPTLKLFLRNQLLGFVIPIAALIITMASIFGGIIRLDFFPSVASDRVSISLEMPKGTHEKITDSILSKIEESVWLVNEDFRKKSSNSQQIVRNSIRRIGPSSSDGSLLLNLLPGELRDFSANEITAAIRIKAGEFDEVESLSYGSGSRFGGVPVAISLLGIDIDELKSAKRDLKKAMVEMPVLKDISDNDPAGVKEIQIKLNENAYSLGLNLQKVMNQIRYGFFGYQVQRFQRGRDEIKVWVRYDQEDRSSIKNLEDVQITTASGNRVPFSEIATYAIKRGDVLINHLEGKREIQVYAELKNADDSATEAIQVIRDEIMPSIISKYSSVSVLYEGQNREAEKTTGSSKTVFPLILTMIYITIAFTFRSYSQPLLLLIMIPFSLIGVAWGHWIHGFKVNILSFLGIIALIGILVNDGLVLIGKLNYYLKSGLKFGPAIYKASMSRFRAIFLTSITTIAGLMPLLWEESRQAQFLKPMAISISYGIAIATVLTLIMLPLLLSLSNSIKVFVKWLITGKKITREEVERAIIEQKSEKDGLL